MYKIVLFTDASEEDTKLIQCLRKLFPECEIKVRPKRAESLGQIDQETDSAQVGEGRMGE